MVSGQIRCSQKYVPLNCKIDSK